MREIMFLKCKMSLLFLIISHNFDFCSSQHEITINKKEYGIDKYSQAETIPIGLITDQFSKAMGTMFEHAIDVANAEIKVPLRVIKEEVTYGDSFQAYGILCKLLQHGVAGIFGPSSPHTAKHLTPICDAKDVPYFFSEMTETSEAFNLYPNPFDFSKALYFLLTAYEWSSFIFLYESVEYLNILNGLMSLYGNNSPTITVLRYDMEMNNNYKSVLRRVRKSEDNRIVVVGSTDTMPEFLKQAQQVGIINEDYMYIIGNLDFHSFDLEEYKYSEANITSFRMFSPEHYLVKEIMDKMGYKSISEILRNGSCPITLNMALSYDSVQLFAETTKYLTVRNAPLNCSDRSESVLDHGSTFKNYMRTLHMLERTLTGEIYFEGNIRKGYSLDIIELHPSGIVKIGTWNDISNLTILRVSQTSSGVDNRDNSLVNKTFIVLLNVPNEPYASLKESFVKLEGNSQYEGYGVDLIETLAEKLGFNFIFKDGGSDYGSYNSTTNTSTGMLKEIREGRAHLAITDLTITAARQQGVDFSIPFMNLGIAIIHLKPQKAAQAFFTFMDPFSREVWWLLGLSFLLVSFSFFILGRLSPSEWDNPHPCIEEPTELVNQFTIGNSLWFTTGALLQQGSEMEPKAISTRTVASIWWFFTLLMVSSYTANLASFLTIEKTTSLIDSIDDLVENKHGVVYGAKKDGSTREFFEKSEDPRHKIMNKFMNDHPEYLTNDNTAGIKRVDKGYAFLMESTSIEYNTMRLCNLSKIGDTLDEKGYGIAMIKNWPYRDKFNNALLQLQEQGALEKLKNKWWKEMGADGKVILELARSKDGEKSRWISVPRKMFRAPSATSSTVTPTLATTIAYSKNDSLTSLSFSDDNSSIQSSPWQRDHCWKQLSPRSGISKAMSLYYQRPRSVALSKIAVVLARKKRRKPCDRSLCPIGKPIFEHLSSIVLNKDLASKTPEKFLSSNKNDIEDTNLNSIVLKASEKIALSNKNDIKEINKDNEKGSDTKNNWSVKIDSALINEEDGCSSSSTATLTGNDISDNRMEDGPISLAPSFMISPCQNEKVAVTKESKDVDIFATVEDVKSNTLKKVKEIENEDIVSTTTRNEGSEPELNGSSDDASTLNSKIDKVDPNDQSFCVKLNEDQRLKAPKQRVKLNIIVQKLIDRVPERLAQLSRLSQSVGSTNNIQGHSNLISQKVPPQSTSSTTRLVEYPQQHVSPRKRILREFEKVSLEDNCNVAGGKRSRAKSNASSSSASSYRSMEAPNNNRGAANTTSKISSGGNHKISENNVHRPSSSTYTKSSTTSTLMTTAPTRLYSSYSINSLLGGSGCSSSKASTLANTNVGTSKRSIETTVNPMGYHPKHHQNSSQQHYSDPSYLRAMLASPKSPEQCSGIKSPSIPVPKIRSPPYVSPLRDSQAFSEIVPFNNKTRYDSDHSLSLDSSSPMHSQNQSYYLPYTSLSKYVPTISNSSNTTTTALNNSGCTAEQHSSRFPSAFNRTSSPGSVTNLSNQPASTSIGNSRENSPSNSRTMTDSPRDTVPRTVPKKTASIRRQFASPTTAVVNSGSASSVDRPFEDTYSSQDRITPVSGANISGGGPPQLQRGSPRCNIVPSPLQHYYMYPPTTPTEGSSPVQQSSPLSPGIVLPVGSGGTNNSASTAAQYIPSIMPSAYMNPYFALAALRQPQLWSHYGSASLPVHMPSVTNSPSLRLSPSSFHSFAYSGVNAAMAAVMQHQQQQILASTALMHGHSLSRTPVMLAPQPTVIACSGAQDAEVILTEQTTDLAADEIPNNATGLRLEAGRSSSIKEEHISDVPLNLSKH